MKESNSEVNQNTSSGSFLGFKLSENIAIAAVPLAAYLLIFAVESGYLSVFQLPYQFISFDLAEIFVASSALLGVAFAVIFILNTLADFFISKRTPPIIVHKIRIYTPLFLLFLSGLVLFRTMWREWWGLGVGFAIVLLLDLGTPLITQRKNKNYLTKIARAEEFQTRIEQRQQSLVNKLIHITGKDGARIIFYFSLILFIAYQTGRSIAIQKSDFFIVNTNPEQVVLYLTKDQAIAASFDRILKEIEPGFVVIDFSQNSEYVFYREKVGPLKLSKSQSNR
jgi:hypothetical protein